MNNKVLIGGLIGGVTFFLLGWLIYGFLLLDYMKENSNQSIAKPMNEFLWWSLILSNLIWGYFLALILSWTNTSSMSSGMQKGAVIGLLIATALDFGFYAMSTMYSSVTPILVDMAANTIMYAIGGAVIGWYMGMGKKEA